MSLFKKYIKTTGLVVAGLVLGLQVALPAKVGATYMHDDHEDKVVLCHTIDSNTEPFEKLELTKDGVINDHIGWDSEDIVPEFELDGQTYSQNWDAAGQAIWNNNCEEPVQTPETATLTIKKAANPQHPNFDFTFTSDELGDFALDDDNDPTLSNEQVFTGLTAGEYGVRELPQFDWMLTDLTCEGTQDYDVVWNDARVQVRLQAGDNVVCTFTNDLLNAVGGFKFNDKNGNGKWDKHEKAMKGWKITITNLNNGETTSIKTNKDGFYTFTGLKPGTYKICEEQRAGWVQTFPATDDGCHETTLKGPGQESNCFSFGNTKEKEGNGGGGEEQLGEINGSKFNDVNGDSAWNTGEPTLSNWTITLKDANGNELATQQTDQNGFYSFKSLHAGAYLVCETQQAGWSRTYPVDSDCHEITLAAGEAVTADFGNKPMPQVLGRGAEVQAATLVNTGANAALQVLFGITILSAVGAVHFLSIRRKDYAK